MRYQLFVLFTLTLTAAVGFATYRTSQLLKDWIPDRNLLLLPSENVVRMVLIGICITLGLLSGLPFDDLGWTIACWQASIAEGIVWGVLMAFGFYGLSKWFSTQFGGKYYNSVIMQAMLPRNRSEYYLTFVAMIGIVLAEEILFRSLLLGGLQPLAPQILLLAATSLLFGLFHTPQGLWGITGAAVAGGLLGLLYIRTGSLLAPISAHYVTNMVQISIAWHMAAKQKTMTVIDGEQGTELGS